MARASHLVVVEASDDAVEATTAARVPLPALELAPPRRPTWPTLAALAITAGVAAVALGAWALLAGSGAETTTRAEPALERSLEILADSTAERHVLRGSLGRIALVVTDDGAAVLTLDGLGIAQAGTAYQAWVVEPGSATPVPDTAFDGSARVVPLARVVRRGARVGVTLEPSGGADRPSRPIRLSAVRS